MAIKFVDIFAGPGGLNEGFASLRNQDGKEVFRSTVAAEMDKHAVATLQLRKFYRECLSAGNIDSYIDFIKGKSPLPYDNNNIKLWNSVTKLTPRITLGSERDNEYFDELLKATVRDDEPWVLLGGPPCQAYSNIRRWTYRTESGFDLSEDHRAHLYKEYLRVLSKFGPSVFVMENVKGLLSSPFFNRIIDDLTAIRVRGASYLIYSLTLPPERTNLARDYVVQAEKYGVPQARHRVILLGVRSDIARVPKTLNQHTQCNHAADVLKGLPKLRSGFSRDSNDDNSWLSFVSQSSEILNQKYSLAKVQFKSLKQSSVRTVNAKSNNDLLNFITGDKLGTLTNHETRSHIKGDVQRYLFASLFQKRYGLSPKTHDFPEELVPNHKNWKTGHFNDRFRVIKPDAPAPTITSHIAKDGHAYIHYDPTQARSLTVREAARIQTFPDNYFFCGPRTEQYKQVGNAVPPYLARQIANVVAELLS